MSEPSPTAGKGAAAASRSEPKATPKDRPEAESTLDDASHSTTCTTDLCRLGDKVGKWAGFDNFECPRCGYATVSEDTVRARNPKHFK